jgi:F-type H+-transporting ATPase subunit b
MIEINSTLIYQIIGFFFLLIVLNKLLYKPVQKILKEREERIDGTLKKAASTQEEVEGGYADYEQKLKEAAIKGQEQRNKVRAEGLKRETELIDEARKAAALELDGMRGEIEKSTDEAMAGLKIQARSISKDIAEKILERKIAVLLVAFLLPLLPSVVLASSGGEGGGAATTWKLINFAILVVGVYFAWTKGLKPMLEKRGADIKVALDEAEAAKNAADKLALEYGEKLSLLDARIKEIHTELQLEGEAEKERIITEAGAAAARIAEQVKTTAEQELKKARIEIRREAARLAIDMAEEILTKELKPEDQSRLVRGYIDNLRLN